MENENKNTHATSILDYSRYTPVLFGVAYFIGFIIVNSFIPASSNSELSLFNVKYLSSGIFYIFLLLSIVAMASYFFKNPTDDKKLNIMLNCRYFMLTFFLGVELTNVFFIQRKHADYFLSIAIFLALFIAMNIYKYKSLSEKRLSLITTLYIITCWGLAMYSDSRNIIYYIWYLAHCFIVYFFFRNDRFRKIDTYDSIFLSVPVIALISVYGSSIYENIQQNYGGGAPQVVHFYLTDNKINNALSEVLKPDKTNTISKGISLYLETDGYYLVKDSGKYYKLPKDIFHGYYIEK